MPTEPETDESLRIAREFFYPVEETPKPDEEPWKYRYGVTRDKMIAKELGYER